MTIPNQKKQYGPKIYTENGTRYRITATVRHDDNCRNGHNTFSITGEIDEKNPGNGHWREHSGGCIHEEIAKHFPELAPFIKWHLTSTDGPLHYVANTMYFARAGEGNLDAARRCANWPDATPDQLTDKPALEARLPALLAEFQRDVETLGLIYEQE